MPYENVLKTVRAKSDKENSSALLFEEGYDETKKPEWVPIAAPRREQLKPYFDKLKKGDKIEIGYNEQLGKWIELINSGMFRPEALEPYGITVPVIAWGLGVERLAMMLHEEKNIRNMFGASADLDWLRTYKVRL